MRHCFPSKKVQVQTKDGQEKKIVQNENVPAKVGEKYHAKCTKTKIDFY